MIGSSKTRKNFVFYLTYHVARYIFPLIITPFLAHVLMHEAFGSYAVINSCVWSTCIFMDFGFFIYAINRVAHAEDDMAEISREASAVNSAKLLLLPVFLLAYSTLIIASGQIWRTPLASVLGAFTGIGVGGTMSWYFQGRQRGGTAVVIETVPQVFQIVFFLLLIRSPSDLWVAILIQAIAPFLSIGFTMVMAHREGLRMRIRLWSEDVKVALRGATPFFVERICFSLYTALVPTIIVMLTTVQEAATYSIADKAMMFLGTLAGPVCQTMMPVLSRRAKHDSSGWRLPVMISAATVAFCGLMACVVFVSAGFVVGIFFSASYQAAVPTAQIFCIAAVFSSVSVAVANFVLVPRNAAGILIWSALCSLAVSLIIQIELIPHYGAAGAACARVGAEFVTATILTIRAFMLFRQSRKTRSLEAVYT